MSSPETTRIAVGVIRKPHGVHGEASVESWTTSLERFDELRGVTLVSPDESKTRDVTIESARPHAGRVLLKFSSIDSPEDVRDVQDWTIEIPESQARPLEEDEYFLHDLVGVTLVDREGRNRGIVKDAYYGGGGLLLTVDGPKGEYDVPFAAEICTKIDIGKKQIIVNLPEGLDDLDHVED